MIALLSDIHFCDASAQIGNVATPAFETVLHEITTRARRIAQELGIDPTLIASRATLILLAQDWPRHQLELMEWQRELLKL